MMDFLRIYIWIGLAVASLSAFISREHVTYKLRHGIYFAITLSIWPIFILFGLFKLITTEPDDAK